MKILVSIADYGGRATTPIVKECFNDSTFNVVVVSTVDGDMVVHPSIGESLPFVHRHLFAEEKDNYDYFFYTENDILYTKELLKYLFENFDQFGKESPLGVIRYEEEQLIDFGAVLNGSKIRKMTEDGFQPINDHQASYLVNKHQLETAIASGRYLIKPQKSGGYGLLETGASNIYYECGLTKMYPKKNLESLLVKHMDLKWKYLQPRYTINNLYRDLQ